MSSEVAGYFERLRTYLRLDTERESDVMRELATHVEDRIAQLTARGVPEERARRIALEGFGRPQAFAHLVRQAHVTTPWPEALLGASAFAALAAIAGLQLWHAPMLGPLALSVIIAMALYGLWLGRPVWFYPWAGAALCVPMMAGYVAFALLHRIGAGGQLDALGIAGLVGAALYFPAGLFVVAAAVLVAVRRDWLDASVLLSPLPVAFALIVAIHRAGSLTSSAGDLPQTALLLGGVYLCMAVASVLFLRAPVRAMKVAALVGAAVVLLYGSMLLIDPASGASALIARGALLVAFLLSPALVARHA